MKELVASVMLFVSTLSWAAEDSIFLRDKPSGCMSAIESALIHRGWKISFIDKYNVRASIYGVGRGVTAEISVFYREGSFYYTEEATKKVTGPNQSTPKEVDTDIPKTWVENLKRDTINFCQGVSSSPSKGEEKDIKGRLEELQNLHKEGLISDDEYKVLRKNILESI